MKKLYIDLQSTPQAPGTDSKRSYDKVVNSFKRMNKNSFCKYVTDDFYSYWSYKYLTNIKSYISIKGDIYLYWEFEYNNMLIKYEQHKEITFDQHNTIIHEDYNDRYKNILTESEHYNLMYNIRDLRKYIVTFGGTNN